MSRKKILFCLIFIAGILTSCSFLAKNEVVEKKEVKSSEVVNSKEAQTNVTTEASDAKYATSRSTIIITPNSPADTVRSFYKALREKRFRDAMLMTNLGSAVEGLNVEEVQDLAPYFEQIAVSTPVDIEINGEQLAGNTASVFAKLPDEDQKLKITELNLRKEKEIWLLLLADEKAEVEARKEGKNYLFNLRIEIHHSEVEAMLERISKAQFVAAQTIGGFGDMQTLVAKGLLPADIQTTESTGYRFSVSVSSDKKTYQASAEPEKYAKSGKLSYFLDFDGKNSRLKSQDTKGMPIRK